MSRDRYVLVATGLRFEALIADGEGVRTCSGLGEALVPVLLAAARAGLCGHLSFGICGRPRPRAAARPRGDRPRAW